MNFRSKYLIINNKDRGVSGTPTDFTINFYDNPFVGKQVYKITPRLIRFPNTFFNVIEGYNDRLIISGTYQSFPHFTEWMIFPPGMYTAESWLERYNYNCDNIDPPRPYWKLQHLVDDEKKITVLPQTTEINTTLTWSAPQDKDGTSAIFNLMGITPDNATILEAVPNSTFDQDIRANQKTINFQNNATPTHFASPAAFNWNDVLFVETNITHSNSVDSNRLISNLFDIVPIDQSAIRTQMLHGINDLENAASVYIKDGNTVQNIRVTLKTARGDVQQTYDNFECIMLLRFYYNMM